MELYQGQNTTLESLAWQRQHAPPRESIRSVAPPLPVGKEYHVFFSCHNDAPDSNRVKVVARELEQLGYKCCIFPKDFDIGKSVSENIRLVLEKSMRIVCILSSAYIKEEWAQMEMEVLSRGDLDKLVFIPVLIEPSDIPPFLKYFRYINALSSRETWWGSFISAVKGDVPNMKSKKKYHAFFAHAPSDSKWVAETVRRLETPQESLVCCYLGRDFRTGSSMKENVENAIKRSLTVVLVVSKNFLSFEWKKYYEGRLRNQKVIPVIVSECNLPIELDDMICIDARSSTGDWTSVLSQAIKQHDLNLNDDAVTSSSCFIRENPDLRLGILTPC